MNEILDEARRKLFEDNVAQIARNEVARILRVDPDGLNLGTVAAYGAVSNKMLGQLVANAGLYHRFVLVDLSGVSSFSNGKPVWKK